MGDTSQERFLKVLKDMCVDAITYKKTGTLDAGEVLRMIGRVSAPPQGDRVREAALKALTLVKKWYVPVCLGSEYLETKRAVEAALAALSGEGVDRG